MAQSTPSVAIVVAIIGLAGTIGATLIANWDKLFMPRDSPAQRDGLVRPEPSPVVLAITPGTQPKPAPVAAVLNLTGTWRDVNFPGVVGEIRQSGREFQFVRRGVLANGVGFESSGTGTVDGPSYKSNYNARYQTGDLSRGSCTGVISAGGSRLDLTCTDSLLGQFAVEAARQ